MSAFREERAIAKKLEILRTAANLFNRNGYFQTTIEDLANELRLTKGAIYYYVESKEDLLFQCHTLVATECIERIKEIAKSNKTPVEKLEAAMESLIMLMVEDDAVFSVVNRANMLSGDMRAEALRQRDEYESIFQSIIEEGITEGYFHSENKKLAKLLILGAINSIPYWFKKQDEESDQEVVKFFSQNLIKMVMK
ncbi:MULTISPECIES: TetR family transcriptional regulator [Lysinibacillus]|uniref:TetR family transcriptional regulator n=1 Tax=Lysinibacillus xylanilyticus TaxID=582475 RepID=A0ABV3VXA0_9BACI